MTTPDKFFFASVTRISDLAEEGFDIVRLPRKDWRMADYVVGEVVTRPNAISRADLRSGRMIDVVPASSIK